MKTLSLKIVAIVTAMSLLSGCARDLSSDMYTSDSTLSLTLEGVIVAARPVKVKESDKLANNGTGILAGGAMGAVAGSTVGGGASGTAAGMIGGAVVGGLVGGAIQGKLGESKGYEYIVKVDSSKLKDTYFDGNAAMRNAVSTARVGGLITVVQGTDVILREGQKVYVTYSENRTRVIAAY